MKIQEPPREIDVIHETDVLVIGSGPGGLAFVGRLGAASAWRRKTIVARQAQGVGT